MSVQVDFVKGHCGWDTLTLVPEGQIPAGEELTSALKILAAPVDGGLEVGFMGRGERPDEIRLRMVDSTSRDWIPMCGGMTQVIGKALVETFFREYFSVEGDSPTLTFKLLTPAGVMVIHIDVRDGKAARVTTVMDGFVQYLHQKGIEPLTLNDCEVLRVGDYCVFDLAALERAFPGNDFTGRNASPQLDIVNEVLKAFRRRHGFEDDGVIGMMYDSRPEGPGQFRIYPRFYSEDLAAARLPYEFQCGTGTVAVGVALAHHGLLQLPTGRGRVVFEWGSQRTTRDPFGIRTSDLDVVMSGNRLTEASFSHSVIEILAEGKLSLPAYGENP